MKIKIPLYLLISFLFLGFSFQKNRIDDKYKVIKVNGSIQIKKTGKPLVQGDIFQENTSLQFNSPDSKATVINGEKGRFVITNQSSAAKGNNLIPAINNVASRGGAILTIIDLQNFFQGNICVIDKMKIKIACSDYKMSADNFFYIQYVYKGENINKPLTYSGDSLNISKIELYKVDGKAIEAPDGPQVTLYYRDNIKKTAQLISTFNLVFPNENDLVQEIKIMIAELKTKTSAQKTDEVMSYLNEFYGKPDKDNVQPWLNNKFGIK